MEDLLPGAQHEFTVADRNDEPPRWIGLTAFGLLGGSANEKVSQFGYLALQLTKLSGQVNLVQRVVAHKKPPQAGQVPGRP
ncbi:MAG TPA: hypothetical protein PK867_10720 [Pirellulales bacterium]|nr:hypothetical protein [Pirellulales bacterium]